MESSNAMNSLDNSQSKEEDLRDFRKCRYELYMNGTLYGRWYLLPTYEYKQRDIINTKTIAEWLESNEVNERIYGGVYLPYLLAKTYKGNIWIKNDYVKIRNDIRCSSLYDKVSISTPITISRTYVKAFHNMYDMMRQAKPEDFIQYMKDRGMTACPMIKGDDNH